MEEYGAIKRDLTEFLRTASEQDYDAAYYYVGKYDFDQSDAISLEIVADMILEKATVGKKNPYRRSMSVGFDNRLINGADDTHPIVGERVSSRLKSEQSAAIRGITYIPDSEKFSYLISSAVAAMTEEDFNRIQLEIKNAQSFSGQFVSNLKKQIENPIENIGIGQIILSIIAILWVIGTFL